MEYIHENPDVLDDVDIEMSASAESKSSSVTDRLVVNEDAIRFFEETTPENTESDNGVVAESDNVEEATGGTESELLLEDVVSGGVHA